MKRLVLIAFALWFGFLFIGAAQAGLNDGLVAYYPFNGNANDESGSGKNGTVYGATLTQDRFGNANSAYNFNGTDNFIETPPVGLQTGDSFTVSLWIRYELQPNRIWALYFNTDGGGLNRISHSP